jgi:hypothetical protein
MPNSKAELRALVRDSLDALMDEMNSALRGDGVERLETVVKRLGRGGVLPHWFAQLKREGSLPNADGKTVGSVLEMLLVAILELGVLRGSGATPLKVNPARGIDLPDLDLGVKSPSENYCTSEPYFSAYERLYGNNHDCLVMLTNYQTAKKKSPLRLKVIDWRYMRGSEIADASLCSIGKKHRDWLLAQEGQGEARAQRLFRFLAFVNQSDWQAKQLIALVKELQAEAETVDSLLDKAKADFITQNKAREKKDRELIPKEDLTALLNIRKVTPRSVGIMEQLDNWVTETLQDAARSPNSNEWERLKTSPLDGKIGMSLALQWRYNFQRAFNGKEAILPECGVAAEDLMTSPTDEPDE